MGRPLPGWLVVVLLLGSAPVTCAQPLPPPNDPLWTDRPTQPFLSASFQRWYKGFSAKKPEERLTTLQEMLPTRKDIEVLFPKQAEKLWPVLEKVQENMLSKADATARDFTRAGQLWAIGAIDVRRNPKKAQGLTYQPILAALPRHVPVYEAFAESERSKASSSVYLYVNQRWIYFPHLPGVVQILPQLK